MILSTEYDSFQLMAESIGRAREGALAMARHRPDQPEWLKLAEVLGTVKNSIYKLAEEGLARTIKP